MKNIQHSLRVWSGAALLIGTALASQALEVDTLGGGPTQRSRARAGYANGLTLTDAKFNQPSGIAVELDGTLVIADRKNNRLREVSTPGVDATSFTTPLHAGKLKAPVGVAVGQNGLIYSVSQKDGVVHVHNTDGNQLQAYAGFSKPTALAVDSRTNIFVTQQNGRVRVLTPNGAITDLASAFILPLGVAVLDSVSIAVSDAGEHAIYRVHTGTGVKTKIAGGNGPGAADGASSVAQFNAPAGIARALDGSIIVADRLNHRVRRVATNGVVSTLYGGSRADWVRPFQGWEDGDDTQALAREPVAVAVTTNNTIYVAERYWNIIRVVTGTPNLNSTNQVAPSIVCPADITTNALSGQGTTIFYTTGSGSSSNVLIQCFPPSGFSFPIGTTNVTCYAVNTNSHLTNVCDFTVIVRPSNDSTPPIIDSCPGDVIASATSASGSSVSFTAPTAYDDPGAIPVAVVCVPQSGSVFPVGLTNVVCTATDAGGNSSSCSFAVRVNLAPPVFTPNSGFHPMGVAITITNLFPVTVFYTTDGADPTLDSLRVHLVNNSGTNAGSIQFAEPLRDLRSLRMRAFVGTNSSPAVGGVASPATEVGFHRDVVAGIGATVVMPVVVNMKPQAEMRSLQFRVEVTPLNGGPAILPQFRAISILSNDFIQVASASAPNTIGYYNATPYSIGDTRGLIITSIGTNANFLVRQFGAVAMLVMPIDPNASEGHAYRIETLQASATSNGFFGEVAVASMPARTMTITTRQWLVGDVTSHSWYNAGDFGNGDLANNDVNAVFYSSHGVRAPWPFTDVFNAMDAYPAEEDGGSAEGDGVVDSFDLNVVLLRALRLNPYNWIRYWTPGGLHWSDLAALPNPPPPAPPLLETAVEPAPGVVWVRQATIGAGQLGYVIPGETYEVPVYVKTAPGSSVSGLNLRAAVVPNDGAPAIGLVSFIPTLGTENFIWANGVAPNEVLCSWLMVPQPAFAPALTGSNIVGYLRFVVPSTATLGQTYSIQFPRLSGGANMSTPYELEGVPTKFWIFSNEAHTPEVLSDEWKSFFGASTNASVADAQADSDSDGVSNGQEYFEGTSPIAASSRLALAQESFGGMVTLSWLSAPLKLYTVERGPSASGPWISLASDVPGDGQIKQVIDGTPPGGAFYRVRVQP